MRAKDYVARIEAMRKEKHPPEVIVATIIRELQEEAVAVARKRANGKRVHDDNMLTVLREQGQKYRAIAREVGWNPGGWDMLVDEVIARANDRKWEAWTKKEAQ